MKYTDFIENHISKGMVSFHMPGHKGRRIFDVHGMGDLLNDFVEGDITEIPGSDNLSQPQGIIRNVMDRYKALYESEESFISLGGSTLGLMAAILCAAEFGAAKASPAYGATKESSADDAAKENVIAIARNSHKSIFNGITLSGLDQRYVYPEIHESGLVGEIKPEEVERAFTEAETNGSKICAVVIPNPNYYGVCSDIEEIAKIVHAHDSILIVDQAHGAHLRFMYPELSGDNKNADIVIESTHKTLASFTQTAIANVYNKDLVSTMEEKVKLLQSTSPSYILMKSLDMNAELMEKYGKELFESWKLNLENTYKALEEMGINFFTDPKHDISKILLDMSDYGLTGEDLSKELFERGVIAELDSGRFSMCMTGIGNGKPDYERLLIALEDIKKSRGEKASSKGQSQSVVSELFSLMNKPRERVKTGEAWELVPASEAEGLVCAESIIPYPPGIPLIATGEVMDKESLDWAIAFRKGGEKVFGMTEDFLVKARIEKA